MSKTVNELTQLESIRKYLARIGAEPRSLRTAVVKEIKGDYWTDVAVIRFKPDGTIIAPENFTPTEDEATAIKAEVKTVSWPEPVPVPKGKAYPKAALAAGMENVFEFRGLSGQVIMLQSRIERKGQKSYIPWTYWSDGQWRMAEPEGPLPLFGADRLKGAAAVMIHEGAKAARYCQWLKDAETPDAKAALEQHPFRELIEACEHVGWIGGALNPMRTDWSILRRCGVKAAYIIPDNDWPGQQAVPRISRAIGIEAWQLQWTLDWPPAFDLADPFPPSLFRKGRYIGPSWPDMLAPATWASRLVPPLDDKGKGKGYYVATEAFARQWGHVVKADMIVHSVDPRYCYSTKDFDTVARQFSSAPKPSRLLLEAPHPIINTLTYRPDKPSGLLAEPEGYAYNVYTPSRIRPVPGDIEPFHELMEHLFPDELDREVMYRWIATLVGAPEVRLRFGALVVSETHGVGKSLLAEKILTPLVGRQNTSFPSEKDMLESQYTEWLANKRLIVCAEIYAGHSWKAYNRLKSVMSDDQVMVNQKYAPTYQTRCWATVFASSNALDALRIERGDRRWIVPRVREQVIPLELVKRITDWIDWGGLSAVMDWAMGYGAHYRTFDVAPMTSAKEELISYSMSEGRVFVEGLALEMRKMQEPVILSLPDVRDLIVAQTGDEYFKGRSLAGELRRQGLHVPMWRLKIGKQKRPIVFNNAVLKKWPELKHTLNNSDGIRDVPEQVRSWLRAHLTTPEDFISDGF